MSLAEVAEVVLSARAFLTKPVLAAMTVLTELVTSTDVSYGSHSCCTDCFGFVSTASIFLTDLVLTVLMLLTEVVFTVLLFFEFVFTVLLFLTDLVLLY